jgi:hypothetical protein
VDDQARWGQIGGLTAWSRNDVETMTGPARRGFRARFERLVDPDGKLDPLERARRADRARRAHMLTLAAHSAAARRQRQAETAPTQLHVERRVVRSAAEAPPSVALWRRGAP